MPSPDPATHLTEHGITPTHQRVRILNYLLTHRTHPTPEEIYLALRREIITLSRTTVYNTLKLFCEKGLVKELSLEEHGVRYDIEPGLHGHFKCRSCGSIYNFNVQLSEFETDLRDFDIKAQEISFFGICPSCRRKNPADAPKETKGDYNEGSNGKE